METCPRCGFDPSKPLTLAQQIGMRVLQLRTERGLTSVVLEEKYGIGRPLLWRIEKGHKHPALVSLERIAAALGVSIRDLIPDTDPNGQEGGGE